jgi:hypothetical protein
MLLAADISVVVDGIGFVGGIVAVLFSLVVVGVIAKLFEDPNSDAGRVIVLGFGTWIFGIGGILTMTYFVQVMVYLLSGGK